MALLQRPFLLVAASAVLVLVACGRRLAPVGATAAAGDAPRTGAAASLLDASSSAAARREGGRSRFPVAPVLHLAGLSPPSAASPALARGARVRVPRRPVFGGGSAVVAGGLFAAKPSDDGAAAGDDAAAAADKPAGAAASGGAGGASVGGGAFLGARLDEPGFEEVLAERADGEVFPVRLPEAWVQQLEPGSVRVFSLGRGGITLSAICADLESEVMIRLLRTDTRVARHEMHMIDRLQALHSIGVKNFTSIVSSFERYVLPDWTYLLIEPAEFTLADLVKAYRVLWPDVLGEPVEKFRDDGRKQVEWRRGLLSLPVREALPILIDLLRGLRHLDAADILHANLSPENILIADHRAIVAGLGDCVARDPNFDPSTVTDKDNLRPFISSVMLEPPEVTDGAPLSPSGHVYTVGLLYLWLRFGYNPAERAALMAFEGEADERELREADQDFSGRRELRRILHENFDVEKDPSWEYLHKQERLFLKGMLNPDPKKRWASDYAWKEVMNFATQQGLRILPERDPPTLPPSWPSLNGDRPDALDDDPDDFEDAWQ